MNNLSELFTPKPLSYYKGLVPYEYMTLPDVRVNKEQAAAIIKAHDHGISQLDIYEIAMLDQVMSILKTEIRS